MSGLHRNYALFFLALFLLLLTVFIFYLDHKEHNKMFTFAVLDIGQGDALYIESPTGTQILVDGGPPRRVLGELAQVMPLFDRSLDAIIVTNPDLDHIGGFLDVLDHYKVGAFIEPGTYNTSETYKNLKKEIKNKNIKEILARRGMQLDLGGGAMLEILFPDRDVSDWTTNDGSVVARLTYGENSFMLMGDSTIETEKIILAENTPESLDSDILKVGHHGSRTSTSENFLKAVTPEYALISLGKDNNYNHPHQEVLDVLGSFGVKIIRTDLDGTILFKCAKMEACEIKK